MALSAELGNEINLGRGALGAKLHLIGGATGGGDPTAAMPARNSEEAHIQQFGHGRSSEDPT